MRSPTFCRELISIWRTCKVVEQDIGVGSPRGTNTDLQPDYQMNFRPVDRTINYLMWVSLRGKSLAAQILFCFGSSVLNCGKIMIRQKYQMWVQHPEGLIFAVDSFVSLWQYLKICLNDWIPWNYNFAMGLRNYFKRTYLILNFPVHLSIIVTFQYISRYKY